MSELPESWLTIKLSEDVVYKKGKKPKLLFVENENNDLAPYIDIKAFEKGIIRKYAHPDDGVRAISDETLMVWDGARSGLVGNGIKGIIGSTLMRIKPIVSNKKYFHFFLESQYGNINSRTKGMGIPHVDPVVLWNISYPLAPLNEQIRIANKFDSLLGKLEATQKHLDKIPTLLKRFRQSVLAAAVSGELTAEWRNNRPFDNKTTIGNISEPVRYGTSKKCSPDLDGSPVLRIPNIKNGTISFKDLKYANFNEKEIESLSLRGGDILIIRSNGSLDLVGQVALVEELETTTLYAGYLIRIRIKNIEEHLPKYILYALQSPQVRGVIELTARSTSGVNNINSKELQSLSFLLPDIKEQKQIVHQVETLFKLADKVEQQYQVAKQRTDKLTQSILAKAFRGELVPQDPNDEPASELLKRIKESRA